MTKFIYKITNKLNGKIYIGQTTNPTRRFQEHRARGYGNEEEKILYKAFDKYGISNFSFEIIEEVENYNEREKYWIKFYNCISPNGYNMSEGGENPPVFYGKNHPLCSHSEEIVSLVKKMLKETKITSSEIAKVTGYNTSSINRINLGELWFDKNEIYPLRKNGTAQGKEERCLAIIEDLLHTTLTQKEIASKYGVSRTTVTALNRGQNFKQSNLNYPLRKGRITSKK